MSSKGCVLDLRMRDKQGTNVTDYSRYGNDGTLAGCKWVENGLEFNGVSDYVNCGGDASLRIVCDFTFMAWAKGNNQVVVNRRGGSSTCSGGYVTTIWGDGKGIICIAGSAKNITQTTSADDGEVHLIALTYTGTRAQLYLDGYENGYRDDFSGNVDPGLMNMLIGTKQGTSGFYNGTIYNVIIYNRALTLLEIKHEYNATKHKYI